MDRPQLRADLAENVHRFYCALWRRARTTHSALVDTTWAKLAIACGYEPTAKVLRSLQRYADLLAEAGLITYGGATHQTGAWRCLHIELLEPPSLVSTEGRSSSAGHASFACEARRRRESPQQTVARRRSPWRRCGGRRDAVPRHDLFWTREVRTPSSETDRRTSSSLSVVSDERTRPRERGASAPPPAPNRAQTSTAAGEEEAARQRAAARKARRQSERQAAWDLRNEVLVTRLFSHREIDGDECDRRIAAIRAGRRQR